MTGAKRVLRVIAGGTRPGRVALPVATWVQERARAHGAFEVALSDLAEVGLPFFDEPEDPRTGRYVHEHTRRWSAQVTAADAVVFVVPEYNQSFDAATKNAVDFLFHEWANKPAGLVAYGGSAGGGAAVRSLVPVLRAVRMMPLPDTVVVPAVRGRLTAEGSLLPDVVLDGTLARLLDALARASGAHADLRSA